MKNFFFIMILAFMTTIESNAENITVSSDALSVTVERELPSGHEQVALVFDGPGAILVANSNFMERPSTRARLGLFHAPLEGNSLLLTAQAEIKNIYARLGHEQSRSRQSHALATEIKRRSPHSLVWRVGELEVSSDSSYLEDLRVLIQKIWELADWKPESSNATFVFSAEKGVILIQGQDQLKNPNEVSIGEACLDLGKTFQGPRKMLCRFRGFGSAYFLKIERAPTAHSFIKEK